MKNFRFLLYHALFCLLFVGAAEASGFRLPFQSSAAIGKSGANVASATGPDCSYFNPANMGFQDDQMQIETSVTALSLPSIHYTDSRTALFNGRSEEELFFFPLVHMVSNDLKGFRLGMSLTYPYGLQKQWTQPYPQSFSRTTSLKVVELNPTISYTYSDIIGIGGGLRLLHSKGKTENVIINPPMAQIGPLTFLRQSSDGDSTDYGYNLALSLRPVPSWTIAATYRSAVTLGLAGESTLEAGVGAEHLAYLTASSLDIEAPAVTTVATSWQWRQWTVELAWDRTYWSDVTSFDTDFQMDVTGTPFQSFEQPIAKNWQDSDSFRLGFTYAYSFSLRFMAGIYIEETPVPEQTLGFELPDGDVLGYSAGISYRFSELVELSFSYLYHDVDERTILASQGSQNTTVDGSFTEACAHVMNASLTWRF
ncbi:OmpP1/FadL family transporter [Desulfogranum japonicum]|uniref:OmpP1/FadL family transporter n=1 Tax=Desulfogranum japonicum TaxID=231447 RepID=UPI0003FCD23A|nr:outer membrane protein transport protein [Desulfogranum japonicum]